MFTSVAPTTSLSLDAHFITRPAATFCVTVDGDGLTDRGILAGDTPAAWTVSACATLTPLAGAIRPPDT